VIAFQLQNRSEVTFMWDLQTLQRMNVDFENRLAAQRKQIEEEYERQRSSGGTQGPSNIATAGGAGAD
jgi:hypothetical protein